VVFRMPCIRLLEAQSTWGSGWGYVFAWASQAFDGSLGACHALEIPFVWDNLHQPGVPFFVGRTDGMQPLADAMHAAWIAFARDADPNHGGLPPWPAYDREDRAT